MNTVRLTSIGDEIPWGDPKAHGDPFERIDAFNQGRTYGISGCLLQS